MKSTYEINLLGLGLTQAEISTIEAGVTPTTSAILQQLEAKDNAIVAQEKKVEEVKKKVDDLEKQKELSADASVDTSKEEKAVADAQAAYDASKAILDEHDKNRAIVKERTSTTTSKTAVKKTTTKKATTKKVATKKTTTARKKKEETND